MTGGHGQPGRELLRPEVLRGDERGGAGGRLEVPADRIGIDDQAAALGAIERLGSPRPRPVGVRRIDIAAADLISREDVRAIDRVALRVHEPVHVRQDLERAEVWQGSAVPDAVRAANEGDRGTRGVDAGPIIVDVATVRLAKHDLDASGIGRPDREAQGGGATARRLIFVSAQAPAIGEVIAFDLRGRRVGAQAEAPVAIGGVLVMDFRGDAPEVGALRAIERHSPLELLARLREVERDRGDKGRAPILADDFLHGRVGPVLGITPLGVPAAAQPGIAEDASLQSGEEPELHCLEGHGVFVRSLRTRARSKKLAMASRQRNLPFWRQPSSAPVQFLRLAAGCAPR